MYQPISKHVFHIIPLIILNLCITYITYQFTTEALHKSAVFLRVRPHLYVIVISLEYTQYCVHICQTQTENIQALQFFFLMPLQLVVGVIHVHRVQYIVGLNKSQLKGRGKGRWL